MARWGTFQIMPLPIRLGNAVFAGLVAVTLSTSAKAETQFIICDHFDASNRPIGMYSTFDMEFEEVSSGIVGTAKSTLDDRGELPGSMGPSVAYAVNGDAKRYILTNLKTGHVVTIDRRTGMAKSYSKTRGDSRPMKCRTAPPKL